MLPGRTAGTAGKLDRQRMDVMADDTKRASRDGKFLSLEQDWEAEYWAKRFGVSRESLEQAVAAVGASVANVDAYLNEGAVAHG
jgi:hypothetical protein